MPELVIIGAGGFGREVFDVVDALNNVCTPQEDPWEVLAFLDDGVPDPKRLAAYDVPLLPLAALDDMPATVQFSIGIGDPKTRRRIDDQLSQSRRAATLIHPTASIGRAVTIGQGAVICSGVRLTNNIELGRQVHLNLNSTVGHDARLCDYVTVSPLVAISGYVTCEADVMLGTGATLNPGVTVGHGSIVGSGSAVLKDVEADSVVVGVPAKPRAR